MPVALAVGWGPGGVCPVAGLEEGGVLPPGCRLPVVVLPVAGSGLPVASVVGWGPGGGCPVPGFGEGSDLLPEC